MWLVLLRTYFETDRIMDLIELYRSLHRCAELSFEEHRTSRTIADVLDRCGIEWQSVARTGIAAFVRGEAADADPKRAVVLRADIDALPITESDESDCRSDHQGVMHACGHDLHATVVAGVLAELNAMRNQLHSTVIGIFQPGEELNPGGAREVLASGVLDLFDVVAVVGEHCEPMLPTGSFGFRSGKYMASSDELHLRVCGKGGHAAMRADLRDPILPAARLIEELYRLPSLAPDRSVPTIVSIGLIEAKGATNVVPDTVGLEGTMRTFDQSWREQLKALVVQTARSVGSQGGVEVEVDFGDGYPPVVNDRQLTEQSEQIARQLFGNDKVVELDLRPTSDDFGFFTQRYPSLYYRLGVGYRGEEFAAHRAGRLHTNSFRPDTEAVRYGVTLMTNLALALSGSTEGVAKR